MTLKTEPITINIGPQHPSTHGVFRMRATFDGEIVVDLEPVFGYLHRGSEKLAEERTYTQVVTLTDRMDYVASMTNNQGYILAVEKLAGIEPSPRGVWLRMIAAELQRVASHLVAVGFLIQDLGAWGTPLIYAMREREKILDLFEMLCGARITNSYLRPGGVFMDAPDEFWPALDALLAELPVRIDELDELLTNNEIIVARTVNVAVVDPESMVNASFTGPMLRAGGVDWDLRHRDPYDFYDRVQFESPAPHRQRQQRPVLGAAAGDAGVDQDPPPVHRTDRTRAGASARSPFSRQAARWRRLRRGRSAEGRVGLLSGERRRNRAVQVPRACAVPHQPDVAA